MVRVWKVTGWDGLQTRMKEGERMYSDKFTIPGVPGTWWVPRLSSVLGKMQASSSDSCACTLRCVPFVGRQTPGGCSRLPLFAHATCLWPCRAHAEVVLLLVPDARPGGPAFALPAAPVAAGSLCESELTQPQEGLQLLQPDPADLLGS